MSDEQGVRLLGMAITLLQKPHPDHFNGTLISNTERLAYAAGVDLSEDKPICPPHGGSWGRPKPTASSTPLSGA